MLVGYSLLQEFGGLLSIKRSMPIFETDQRLYFYNFFTFRSLSFFLIGVYLRQIEEKILHKKIPSALLFSLILLGSISSVWEYTHTNDTQFFIGNIIAAMCLMLFAIKHSEWSPCFLTYVGRELSLYVYVFHMAIYYSLNVIAVKLHFSAANWFQWTRPFWIVILSLVFSWLFAAVRKTIQGLILKNNMR